MEQLKMYLLPEIRMPETELPEGYSISNYRGEADREAWTECCRDGSLIDESPGADAFRNEILGRPLDPYRDVFFLDHHGRHIATATCFVNEDGEGALHMVGMRKEYRGRGLSRHIVFAAMRNLSGTDVKRVFLTTDDFRISAIRTYLRAGFLPVDSGEGMRERWAAVLRRAGIPECRMLREDGCPAGTVRAD